MSSGTNVTIIFGSISEDDASEIATIAATYLADLEQQEMTDTEGFDACRKELVYLYECIIERQVRSSELLTGTYLNPDWSLSTTFKNRGESELVDAFTPFIHSVLHSDATNNVYVMTCGENAENPTMHHFEQHYSTGDMYLHSTPIRGVTSTTPKKQLVQIEMPEDLWINLFSMIANLNKLGTDQLDDLLIKHDANSIAWRIIESNIPGVSEKLRKIFM